MMTLEEIRRALADRNLKRVSEATGLSYPTIWKVAREESPQVKYTTLKTLNTYLNRKV